MTVKSRIQKAKEIYAVKTVADHVNENLPAYKAAAGGLLVGLLVTSVRKNNVHVNVHIHNH